MVIGELPTGGGDVCIWSWMSCSQVGRQWVGIPPRRVPPT